MARVAATKRNRDTSDVNRRAALFGSVGIGVAPPLIVWSGNEGRALEFATRSASQVSLRAVTDRIDDYSLGVPEAWARIESAGQDCFFRSTVYRDTNLFVDVLIAKGVETVSQLGSVDAVATALLARVESELQSTRIGVRRSTKLVSRRARQKLQREMRVTEKALRRGAGGGGDDGDEQRALYYDVSINAKSFAGTNAMAVDPAERTVALEWDRRLIVRPTYILSLSSAPSLSLSVGYFLYVRTYMIGTKGAVYTSQLRLTYFSHIHIFVTCITALDCALPFSRAVCTGCCR